MIEKWHKLFDEGSHAGARLIEFFKASDCINHKLLIVRLQVCEMDNTSLDFMCFHLTKARKRSKLNLSYCDFDEIISGLRQGSILEPPPSFNIYMSNLLL